ncbi:NADH-quinone oxidoreductase subunit I [Caldanaerobacter subterraneus subsp. tengcongensis MB4]|uniref:Formate hydrogenlyase subunit 6/NADH:ubiquinone oxidoreductase 23 kD subunit (Chain I) n=2 Tax=Caldanaerobacter subterraneus TaxID=911092 RepID=Q8RDB3_CALS4|nr:4Fe-4S dicluster domain-containing protein [Caldanaerobacter subterraneus]AAM23432.1 Formate hydrogenlyase subunit 6/NADH:ubiquinone oxidoreductase 23 kD subunit (chain I) [Caldanaerobacter subterraneus subsp. tengcongensis MB4]KKC30825.1 hydrogenase subunit EchF [Caldanaerobacter subterraneus subsp. pacificus DSM 12653]MBE3578363.1 4Fe-4S dicluster domain-containing protein [Caldanaerobacter subterraneus]MCS3917090.1 NADH-quinone oxidoreductase subunit I [Caldanaerobacter subterraneus subsp
MLSMLKNVVYNLTHKPATRRYPFEKREPFEGTRGHIENDIEKCILCGICQRVCPSNCIQVDRKEGTWKFEPFACIVCGACVDACPTKSLIMLKEYRPISHEKYVIVQKKETKASAEKEEKEGI